MENLINYFGLPVLIATAVAGALYVVFTVLIEVKKRSNKKQFRNNFDIKV